MKKGMLFFCFLLLTIACTSNEENGGQQSNNYDRTALLTNWADSIIVPSYVNYQTKITSLSTNATTFTSDPTTSNLQALRLSWFEAYKSYQTVMMYNFGKAELISFKESTNTFPADAAGIEANVTNGSYNLTMFSQFPRQGFPGLDYLINGLADNDASIVSFYITNPKASSYKNYLTAVTARLQSSIDVIVNDWNNGYRDNYVAGNGTSVSSSVSKTTNNFVKNYERDIRSAKIGIPAGKLSGGTTLPQNVEAYYKNDISKELLLTAMQSTQDFFNGKHFGSATAGPSLKGYLDYVKAVRGGTNLSDIVNNQFNAASASVNGLTNSFSSQVSSDNSKMLTTYDVMQQNLVYIKLDVMQALNITVDYVDGDGD